MSRGNRISRFFLWSPLVRGRCGGAPGVPQAFADLPQEDAIAIRLDVTEVRSEGDLGADLQAMFSLQAVPQFPRGKGVRLVSYPADELRMGGQAVTGLPVPFPGRGRGLMDFLGDLL